MKPRKISVNFGGKTIKLRAISPLTDEEVEALQYLEEKYIELTKSPLARENLRKKYDMSYFDFVDAPSPTVEEQSHLIGEIDALFAVALGSKSISTFSYLNEYNDNNTVDDNTVEDHAVDFFQNTVATIVRKLFKNSLKRRVNESGNVIFFNPTDGFSVFAMETVMDSNTGEYNLSKTQFMENCDAGENPNVNLEYVKSVVLGYGKWTTVLYDILTKAGKIAYEKTGKETGKRYNRRLSRYYEELKANGVLVDDMSHEYDCAREIVMRKFSIF